jgi:hypothetical protein
LTVVVLVLAATQLALYVDAGVTSDHFDPMRPTTLPRLHANAIHGLWFLSVAAAVLLTVAYFGGARLRPAAAAVIGTVAIGASVWTTPLQLGASVLPWAVRSGELVWAVVLCAAAVVAFVIGFLLYRRGSTRVQ